MKTNVIKAEVIEALPNLSFKVRSETGAEIIAHLAGRLRLHRIRIVAGDTVLIETTPYDARRARIVRRL